MIQIGRAEKRIDWNAIRAEYIGGGISQRKLAEKYHVPYSTLRKRARSETWTNLRETAERKTDAKVLQKTADIASENAATAARIRAKLLRKVEQAVDALPDDLSATETRETIETRDYTMTKIRRIRDLTSSLKDLADDLPRGEESEADHLEKIRSILGAVHSVIE